MSDFLRFKYILTLFMTSLNFFLQTLLYSKKTLVWPTEKVNTEIV